MMSSGICLPPSHISAFLCVGIILRFQVVVPDDIALDFSTPCRKRLSSRKSQTEGPLARPGLQPGVRPTLST